MRQGKALHYSIAAGWFVTSLAAILVATILVPEESRSAYFWRRVWWTEFLIVLFWGSTACYLLASGKTKDNVSRLGGIASTISIVVAIYALLSFSVMLVHVFIPETNTGNRIHFIGQIVFFLGAALCVIFLSMARAGTTYGLNYDKTKTMSPSELHDLLVLSESILPAGGDGASNKLKVGMKQLREALLYALNESASLMQSSEYQTFCGEVRSLCFTFEEGRHSEGDDECYSSMTETVEALVAKAKLISARQIRR